MKIMEKLGNYDTGFTVSTSKEVAMQHLEDIRDCEQEVVAVFLLDTKNRCIKRQVISVGTVDSCHLHPREVYKEAIRNNATSIIIAHNHPSGDTNPSPEDRKITKKLKEGGELLGINLLDHLIIGKKKIDWRSII